VLEEIVKVVGNTPNKRILASRVAYTFDVGTDDS